MDLANTNDVKQQAAKKIIRTNKSFFIYPVDYLILSAIVR